MILEAGTVRGHDDAVAIMSLGIVMNRPACMPDNHLYSDVANPTNLGL